MRYSVRIRGGGRTTVAAYGLADAEHQVEKEIGRLWTGARVQVREVRRDGDAERIAEEYSVEYRLLGTIDVDADDADHARREAFRRVRSLFQGTRYWTVAWDAAEATEEGGRAE